MRICYSGAFFQRKLHIVETGGLGGKYPGRVREKIASQSYTRRHTAAAAVDDNNIGRGAHFLRLILDLDADGALARDGPRIVVGMHNIQSALSHQLPPDGFAVFGRAIVGDDFGTVFRRIFQLQGRRVFGHDNSGGNSELFLCRIGNRLRMIAEGCRKHAAAFLFIVHLQKLIERAAYLKGTGGLQIFGFQQQPETEDVVQKRRFQQRGQAHVFLNTRGAELDILEGQKIAIHPIILATTTQSVLNSTGNSNRRT